MPMTTADVPNPKGITTVAEAKGTTRPAPKPDPAPAPELAPAGQSGDPDVQKLLAEREGYRLVLEPDDPEVQARRDAARKALDRIDEQLADLGYTAK
jgi:hypothetical protein